MFQAGDLDYTPISTGDATWIAYDKTLGPSLRIEPSPSVEFYGFNTTKAPFNDVHVRRAFALGIDWKRIVTLLSNPLVVPATGMVPDGVPGHSATDYGPKFDLVKAKSELAAAGYPQRRRVSRSHAGHRRSRSRRCDRAPAPRQPRHHHLVPGSRLGHLQRSDS